MSFHPPGVDKVVNSLLLCLTLNMVRNNLFATNVTIHNPPATS